MSEVVKYGAIRMHKADRYMPIIWQGTTQSAKYTYFAYLNATKSFHHLHMASHNGTDSMKMRVKPAAGNLTGALLYFLTKGMMSMST